MGPNARSNREASRPEPANSVFLPGVWVVLLVAIAGFAAFAAARGQSKRRPLHRARAAVFTARPTPARLARGRYLVETVSGCFDCHAAHEYVNGEWRIKPGTKGAGSVFSKDFIPLPPGSLVVAPNITPDRESGIGSWSDAEIERAIRHGLDDQDQPIFNLMPYWQFQVLSNEDVKSIIVYLRSLPPVRNDLPSSKFPFPVKVQMNDPRIPPLPPNASPLVRRGWYLVRISGCVDCHTAILPGGKIKASLRFAGGLHFHGPFGDVYSLNITPDASGISFMTEGMFAKTMQTGRVDGDGLKLSSVMPFDAFRNLRPGDVRAIYAYLRTVRPVHHEINNTDPPTFCKICLQKHGLGDRN